MSRVEWSRYNGDDIEALVAMFISADFPEAERITPSSGDGGIDVLVKTDKTRVYQVKKFHSPLTSNQKTQITESVDRLVSDPRVAHLTVDEWHIVMPWDPTLEAKAWLTAYVRDKGLPEPVWDGMTRCDLWASTYPNIVDYYLHGNAERIKQAALDMVHGLRLKEIADQDLENFDVSVVANELLKTAEFLNNEDPFFSYGLHVEPRSSVPEEDLTEVLKRIKPGVVLSTQWGTARMSVQIDIYPKNRVALQIQPINFNLEITPDPGSPEATAVEQFLKYGSPLDLPRGSVTGSSTAPGGLGGVFENAALIVLPAGEIAEQHRDLRILIFDPEGSQIDALVLYREYTTSGAPTGDGPRGLETRLRDATGIFQAVWQFDVESQTHMLNVHLDRPGGQLAVDTLPVLRFYRSLQAPNSFTVAPRFGPVPSWREVIPEDDGDRDSPHLWHDIAKSLTLIQDHTPIRLHFPDTSHMDEESITSITRTGALLNGQTAVYKVGSLATQHDPEMPETSGNTVLLMPWEVSLPEGTVGLGHLAYAFKGALVARATESPQGLLDVWSVEENELLVRMLTEEEREAL